MIEELFNLIKGNAQQDIIENNNIPNEHNNQAVGLATESIMNGLQGALANGGLQQVLNLFGGRAGVGNTNPLVSSITNGFVGNLMGKFGITNPIAQSIAASLIPKVLGNLVSRTSDPNDNSIDMNGIMNQLTGGQAKPQNGLDFNNLLDNLTGGKKVQPQQDHNDDNGFGMDDILRMVTGGQGAQQQQGGGNPLAGLLDMVTKGAQQQQQPNQQGGGGIMDLLKGFM